MLKSEILKSDDGKTRIKKVFCKINKRGGNPYNGLPPRVGFYFRESRYFLRMVW